MQFWAIVVDGFRQSRDRKIFWAMLAITLLVAGAMACIGFSPGKVSLLFGFWEIKTDLFTTLGELRQDVVVAILISIMEVVLGSLGMVLAVVATAGFLPVFLERGAVDVVLSKPMPRWRLFLAKYVGAMVFILAQATVFVVLTFLVVGLRWGVWVPGYIITIPLAVLLFSYLYCISALAAVRLHSTVVCIIITLGAWFLFAGVQSTDDWLQIEDPTKQYQRAHSTVGFARRILPKTQDVVILAKRWSGAAVVTGLLPEPDDEYDREVLDRAEVIEIERMMMNPLVTIGSSLLFEAVIVLLAIWSFCRRDY